MEEISLTSTPKSDILNLLAREADFLCQTAPLVCEERQTVFLANRRTRGFLLEEEMPHKGERKANYITVLCKQCNKEIAVTAKRFNGGRGKFCSNKCKRTWWTGRNVIRKYKVNGRGIHKTCIACGKKFYVNPCNEKQMYCSLECRLKFISMENSPTWKGGRVYQGDYVYLNIDHPHKNKAGYIAEHRLVMEKKLGRYLLPHELVHHKNGIKNDNRPENLDLVYHKKHYGNIQCPYCRKEFLIK